MSERTKHVLITLAISVACVVAVAAIAISATIASVRQTERDEAVKVAAAENGCDYANQVLNCGGGR